MSFGFGICLWTQAVSWDEALRAAQLVDELGFDHLWTVDHLLAPTGDPDQPILEAWSVLSAWAARTRQVRLGLFVGANTFRSPTYTAKLATTLDHISGGRAIVGLGAGWHEREHRAYGVEFGASPGERIGWLDESAGIVRRLLDREVVSVDTGRYRADRLRLLPTPIQEHVPLMIGGSGPKRTLRAVARHADMWNAFGWPKDIARSIGILGQHCRDAGRSIDAIELTVGANVIIRDRPAAAERVWAEQMVANQVTPETNVTSPEKSWLGTSDDIVERIVSYAEVGIRALVVEMAAPYDLETIRILASEVRPRVEEIMAARS